MAAMSNGGRNHSQPRARKTIYDFGANNGDDIPYYLRKADVVVAVEANPSLCRNIAERFASEIEQGKLFLENCVLTTENEKSKVFFHIHKSNHVLSQFPEPDPATADSFEKVLLPSLSVTDVIQRYGDPHYIKVDIERYDAKILRALFANNIRPPFISAESHDIEVFSVLVSLGGYNAFKLVDGPTVSEKYKDHPTLLDHDERELYSFPHHSAGPFGDDVHGEWMSANNFFRLLAFENLGWKDIHATNQVKPNLSAIPKLHAYAFRAVKHKLLSNIRAVSPRRLSGLKVPSLRSLLRFYP